MSAGDRAARAHAVIDAAGRPEVWISLRSEEDLRSELAQVDPALPLAGRLLAVKDNIDVAGLPSTAGCPAYAYDPDQDAPAVARLRAAGAVVLGKTNLDQFATGLVGTRSPYGAVRDAQRPEYISGGSSSGSAVAVAMGMADLALGTDTAGSGRVPAAFQGLVGIKPTLGLVPTSGVVPACRTLDCVTVLAPTVALAAQALWLMAGPDPSDTPAAARSRPWPDLAPLAAASHPRIGVPAAEALAPLLGAGARAAFAAACDRLGPDTTEVDITPLLAAAELLYDGAFVAERHAAFGKFAATHPDALDPSVLAIVTSAAEPSATALVRDGERRDGYRRQAAQLFTEIDVLVLPTAPRQPTLAEVAANPLAVNRELGAFTNFVNLLDLSAIAIPAGECDGGHFGITLIGPAFADQVLADLAAEMLDEPRPPSPAAGIPLFVVGAHRHGQPLNRELTECGARYLDTIDTAAAYRLYALDTVPPKPGLVRCTEGGTAIEGELWTVPAAALGPFLAHLPAPMALGQVQLADGRSVVGFACEAAALVSAPDISHHGSWPAYLAAGVPAGG
jgi:allophanate hydrolase